MKSLELKAIIVDDAAPARKLLRLMLAEVAPDIRVVAEAASVTEAIAHIRNCGPDLVFLDIEMPGKSGLQLATELSRDEIPYEIIFTTAHHEYALDAFRASAIDYLLKPIQEDQLRAATDRVRQLHTGKESAQRLEILLRHLDKEEHPVLHFPDTNGFRFVKISDILYVKANGSYAELHTTGNPPAIVSRNLRFFESALKPYSSFIRVHRSFLINIRQIERFEKSDRGIIKMVDGAAIDLARDRRAAFYEALKLS